MRFSPGLRAPAGERPNQFIYVVGGRGIPSLFMEQQSQPCNQKQREIFAHMLQEARRREEAELESEDDVDELVEVDVVPKLAEEHGASELIARVRKLSKEVDDAETQLSKLGFRCDKDSISLYHDAPKVLREALASAQRSARKERQAALKKYDLAILEVWSAEDAADAKRVVEELL
jgi:hypothetical protein